MTSLSQGTELKSEAEAGPVSQVMLTSGRALWRAARETMAFTVSPIAERRTAHIPVIV